MGGKPWFYSYTFAISTVTIVSGCLAERTNLVAYPVRGGGSGRTGRTERPHVLLHALLQ